MPLYTKAEITIPGRTAEVNPQYSISPITTVRALDTGRANNIPDTYPNTATTSGGWVWINPDYEFATELLAAYVNGTFTGGPEEVAGRGVQLRMFGDLVPRPNIGSTNSITNSSTSGTNVTSNTSNTGTTSDSSTTNITSSTNGSGSPDSPSLAAYIEAELQVEVKKQYPELASIYSNSDVMKSLRVASVALARAIKKYLNTDVKTIQLGLEVSATVLNVGGVTNEEGVLVGIDIDPNPHAHSIAPHRHDIVAP